MQLRAVLSTLKQKVCLAQLLKCILAQFLKCILDIELEDRDFHQFIEHADAFPMQFSFRSAAPACQAPPSNLIDPYTACIAM